MDAGRQLRSHVRDDLSDRTLSALLELPAPASSPLAQPPTAQLERKRGAHGPYENLGLRTFRLALYRHLPRRSPFTKLVVREKWSQQSEERGGAHRLRRQAVACCGMATCGESRSTAAAESEQGLPATLGAFRFHPCPASDRQLPSRRPLFFPFVMSFYKIAHGTSGQCIPGPYHTPTPLTYGGRY